MEKELLLRPATTEDALPAGEALAPAMAPIVPVAVTPEPVPEVPAPVIAPLKNDAPAAFGNAPMVQLPSRKQQSWGALISIFVIVCMIVLGAFYAWGERIADRAQYYPQTAE